MLRLFANLWLDDPSASDLESLNSVLPLIQDLEHNLAQGVTYMKIGVHEPPAWDMDEAFEAYREEEDTWWKSHNTRRSLEYLVRPSGRLDAPVACHLYNPTFVVDDPCLGETDDPSNPCIAQLHHVGFTSENCFMFDHSARREDSRHCKILYPPDLWEIHDRFVFILRSHMKAVVEICWGANVRERMLRHLQKNLRILPLWGRYQGVDLYLELADDQESVKRFIIFANHPQFFMFMKGTNVRAQAFRTEQGGRQDLLLEVASLLGGITIKSGFYRLSSVLLQPFRPAKAVREQRDAWKGKAYAELKSAFPGTMALFTSVARPIGLSKADDTEVWDTQLPVVEHTPKTTDAIASFDPANEKYIQEARLRKVAQFWRDLHDLAVMLTPGVSLDLADKHQCQQIIATIESCEEELYAWDELPKSLLEMIQAQEGLRVDQRPINSRKAAETAYRLLHCKGNPECLSIIGLAFSILIAYGWAIRRTPRASVLDLMVLGAPPRDIVSRVCSACGGRVLDDSTAYYAMNNLNYYVVRSSKTGCGLINCKGGNILLHPLAKGQNYVRALTDTLERIPNPRVRGGAPWEKYFLRHGQNVYFSNSHITIRIAQLEEIRRLSNQDITE
ncbi:hypothetical protein ALT_6656 [Aspergillus lentulus]|uniref:Uncharacterized protein n=1 Tax=Aspergillus lentulus TaxID=293939 RepID=A0AAN4TCL9_ASPLE|nr:hypothetical protein ALT_6656 [Aspergillus lentulus]